MPRYCWRDVGELHGADHRINVVHVILVAHLAHVDLGARCLAVDTEPAYAAAAFLVLLACKRKHAAVDSRQVFYGLQRKHYVFRVPSEWNPSVAGAQCMSSVLDNRYGVGLCGGPDTIDRGRDSAVVNDHQRARARGDFLGDRVRIDVAAPRIDVRPHDLAAGIADGEVGRLGRHGRRYDLVVRSDSREDQRGMQRGRPRIERKRRGMPDEAAELGFKVFDLYAL